MTYESCNCNAMGWTVSPESHMLKFQPPIPQNVTVLGDKVLKEVINLKCHRDGT